MKKQLNFRIEEELLAAFDAKLDGAERTEVILQLIRDFVQRKPRNEELNAKDRVRIYDNEVKISKLVNDFAIRALKTRDKNVFEGLTDAELAKLVISQLPKPKDVDEDLRKDMVSLQASLEKLPSVEDITGELSRLRFANNKLIAEREIQQAVVDGLRKRLNRDNPGAWAEFRRGLELAVKHARELSGEAQVRELDFLEFKLLVVPE